MAHADATSDPRPPTHTLKLDRHWSRHCQFSRRVVFFHRLLRVVPDVAGKLITRHHLIVAGFADLQVGVRGLAADDADILQTCDGLVVGLVDVDRHFQSTVLHEASVHHSMTLIKLGSNLRISTSGDGVFWAASV